MALSPLTSLPSTGPKRGGKCKRHKGGALVELLESPEVLAWMPLHPLHAAKGAQAGAAGKLRAAGRAVRKVI